MFVNFTFNFVTKFFNFIFYLSRFLRFKFMKSLFSFSLLLIQEAMGKHDDVRFGFDFGSPRLNEPDLGKFNF